MWTESTQTDSGTAGQPYLRDGLIQQPRAVRAKPPVAQCQLLGLAEAGYLAAAALVEAALQQCKRVPARRADLGPTDARWSASRTSVENTLDGMYGLIRLGSAQPSARMVSGSEASHRGSARRRNGSHVVFGAGLERATTSLLFEGSRTSTLCDSRVQARNHVFLAFSSPVEAPGPPWPARGRREGLSVLDSLSRRAFTPAQRTMASMGYFNVDNGFLEAVRAATCARS
jgi:hypothetical protein